MKSEKTVKPQAGSFHLLLSVVFLGAAILMLIFSQTNRENEAMFIAAGALCVLAFILHVPGFFVVNPNEARVLIFFGNYVGTIKENGFFWANPFYSKRMLSLRAGNFMGDKLKVNDHAGNPIEIAAVVVWQVQDTYQASFAVDDYNHFVRVQSESALRTLAGKYPYDHFTDDHSETTLRESTDKVNQELAKEVSDRLKLAGIQVVEARISYLAYAPEIAGAMLQRQQAAAMVSARFKIVEGAVSMVEMALEELRKREIVDLDPERKAAMVSNLLVVLCGERNVNPVVNAGTLYNG